MDAIPARRSAMTRTETKLALGLKPDSGRSLKRTETAEIFTANGGDETGVVLIMHAGTAR